MRIIEADKNTSENWDNLVERSINGTLFHKQRFLSYHGDRFSGRERFLSILDGDAVFAQISLAIESNESDFKTALSPYGASYGGFIFARQPSYAESKKVVSAFLDYLLACDIHCAIVTHPIPCCAPFALDTFFFCLLEQGFISLQRDISNVVDLASAQHIPIVDSLASSVRNQTRKACKSGVVVERNGDMRLFWPVLEKNQQRLQTLPTHTLNELILLHNAFPQEIYADIALHNDIPIAGILYFHINKRVNSSFYLAQDYEYRHLCGLTFLISEALTHSQEQGYAYFDFGTSTQNLKARENLLRFKESFSKIGMFRETFRWKAC